MIKQGLLGMMALAMSIGAAQAADPVKVGSKIDTEGSLLGNIILQVLDKHGVKTVNKIQLGTTQVVRGAITGSNAMPVTSPMVVMISRTETPSPLPRL